jgi:hypothetical protein
MPQFDFYSFSGQIFWILFAFYFMHIYILHVFLPKISNNLKIQNRIIKFVSSLANTQK